MTLEAFLIEYPGGALAGRLLAQHQLKLRITHQRQVQIYSIYRLHWTGMPIIMHTVSQRQRKVLRIRIQVVKNRWKGTKK